MLKLFKNEDRAYSHVGFFTIFCIKRTSLKRFYLYMELLRSSTIFKQKNKQTNKHADKKTDLTFFLILYANREIHNLTITLSRYFT